MEPLRDKDVKILDFIIEKVIKEGQVNSKDLPPLSDDYFSRANDVKKVEYEYYLKILKESNVVEIDSFLDGIFKISLIPIKTKRFYDSGGYAAIHDKTQNAIKKQLELDGLNFKKLIWDSQISKYQAKTKWLPLIISIISIIISVIALLKTLTK